MLFNLFNKKNKSGDEPSGRYHQLTVHKIIQETSEAITIVFDQPEREIPYESGQFLTLMMDIEGEEVRRSYSLCSSPHTDQLPAVTVKRVASGKVSNYLNDHLKVGDTIKVMEPMGTFTTELKADQRRHVVMLGGGSGITPLMSLMKSLLHVEEESMVTLIYANRQEESIIFRKELHLFQEIYPDRFYVRHVLETPAEKLSHEPGTISAQILPRLLGESPFKKSVDDFFICGPQGMMDEVSKSLQKLGIAPHQIHKESFVSGGKKEKADHQIVDNVDSSQENTASWDTEILPGAYGTNNQKTSETHEVTIIYDGETYKFAVDPESSILNTAIALDIDLPYSCQSGMCTACMGKCTSGRVRLDDDDSLTEEDLKQGFVLTCVGHPLTSDVIIEID